jgi:hypothetical protein
MCLKVSCLSFYDNTFFVGIPPQVLTRMHIVVSSMNFCVLSLNALSSELQNVYRLQTIKLSRPNRVRNGIIPGRLMNEASPMVLVKVIYTAG